MKLSLVIAAVIAAFAVQAAEATTTRSTHATITRHDRQVIAFFTHHPRLAQTPAGARALMKVLPHVVEELRSVQAVRTVAHELLWKCIAGYPGFRPGGGSGESGGNPAASNGSHFNILQMTDPWAGIHPIGMSPDSIMQAAESQYNAARNRGELSSWLEGQWAATIGPCWKFA